MALYEYDSSYAPPAPVCPIRIGVAGHEPTFGPLPALLDTGADISVVPLPLLQRIGAQQIGQGRARGVWQSARDVDVYVISLTVEGLHWRALRVVTNQENDELILGRQILNRLKLLLDGPVGLVEITNS